MQRNVIIIHFKNERLPYSSMLVKLVITRN